MTTEKPNLTGLRAKLFCRDCRFARMMVSVNKKATRFKCTRCGKIEKPGWGWRAERLEKRIAKLQRGKTPSLAELRRTYKKLIRKAQRLRGYGHRVPTYYTPSKRMGLGLKKAWYVRQIEKLKERIRGMSYHKKMRDASKKTHRHRCPDCGALHIVKKGVQ